MMKKRKIVLAAALSVAAILTGCSKTEAPQAADSSGKLQIVSTSFPAYDWTREILGEHAEDVELTLLNADGIDLHSYQPSAEDMLRIRTCDLFIYVGGPSDTWVTDALRDSDNPKQHAISLLELMGDGVKEEEMVEGMQEADHDHDHEDTHDHESEATHEHEGEPDEHVWLSLKNAQTLCSGITGSLSEIDPSHAAEYQKNSESYLQKLQQLDTAYQAAVEAGARDTLLFCDRFPFRYLVDDYGLTYYAAFSGCSAETEASFETIAFLADQVNQLNLPSVLTIEGATHDIADTVVRSTSTQSQTILTMDSMQSVTSADIAAGATYLSIMEGNLETLKQALS
ncbi:MAG TPA: metal ABC transporter substrate-binding protein [Candidatus Agathobaculum pullicola]|nr:metal ABC transporter substrate-binding protein [Candidatus Agathobaculum pullicola]